MFITTTLDRMRGWMVKRLPEACGIELKGENKWITLIQNASVKAKTS